MAKIIRPEQETRDIIVTLSRTKVQEGMNPYDLIEDQLVPWRHDIWAEGWDVTHMDVDILEQSAEEFEMNSDTITVRVTAYLTPTKKEN